MKIKNLIDSLEECERKQLALVLIGSTLTEMGTNQAVGILRGQPIAEIPQSTIDAVITLLREARSRPSGHQLAIDLTLTHLSEFGSNHDE